MSNTNLKKRNILVTGGTGYIGSHTVVQLLEAGFNVTILDNLTNSKATVLKQIKRITGKPPVFFYGDINDRAILSKIFSEAEFDAVIHFAGLKSVGESSLDPLKYYINNVSGSLALLDEMKISGVRKFIFSSSATVYSAERDEPLPESTFLNPQNPYGRSKLQVERILEDLTESDNNWQIIILRYFNPVGAHPSGIIGEDPSKPTNLFPLVSQVAIGTLPLLKVYGSDYETHDGTGIRDYIHVADLARGHLAALAKLFTSRSVLQKINLGTGKGYTVLEVVRTFERVANRKIPLEFVGRRTGDVAKCVADVKTALRKLDWSAEFGLEKMCEDAWNWQLHNPDGYPNK